MADDPNPLPRRNERDILTCEFCECRLSNAGEVLTRSKKARAMIDLDDDNDKLRKKIADLEALIGTLRTEIEELKKAPEPVGAKDPNDW